MSIFDDDSPNGPEALTPFEFALAGVTPPGSQTLSSLRVIDDMQSLIGGMDDIPVSHIGLRDFLDSGGLITRRDQRRRSRPQTPTAGLAGEANRPDASFVDITPPDMVAPAATGGPAEPIDVVQAELRSVLTQPDRTGPEIGDDLAAELVTGPIAGHLAAKLATGPVASDHNGLGDTTQSSEDPPDPESDEDSSDEAEEARFEQDATPVEAATLASTTDRLRDEAGKFGPIPAPLEDPVPPVAADPETGPDSELAPPAEPLVAATLFGPGDEPTAERADDRPPAVLAAGAAAPALLERVGVKPPPASDRPARLAAAMGRRPGSAMLALVGAGAAAVLVAGSVWWATSSPTSSTEADGLGAGLAAAPSTTDADGDAAAGSLSGPAERSTGGDDEPAEFDDGEGSASSSTTTTESGTTIRATTGDPTTTTRKRSTTTRSDDDAGDVTASETTATTAEVTTTNSSETTSTNKTTTTIRPATTTTTRPPTTTLPPVRPVYIGDRVTIGDFDGPGLAGVHISLHADDDRDGRLDRLVTARTSDSNGRYSFDQPPGCYEVQFFAPSGYRIRSDLSRQYLCLDSGAIAARTDAIAERLTAAPPSGCLVERSGSGEGLGVEVYENSSNWAPSYTFYNRSGGVVARTRNLGPYDTDDGDPTDREWFGDENGFNHRAVWSVAAERDGIESARVTCARD